jgi:uncharacterized membrane protein YgcG
MPAFPGEFVARYRLGEALMDLAEDKVANVRLQVWQALPELVHAGVVPLAQARAALAKADADEDRDVRAAAELALAQLEGFDPSKLPSGAAALLPALARGTITAGSAAAAAAAAGGDGKSAYFELGASASAIGSGRGLSSSSSGGGGGGNGGGSGSGSNSKKAAPRPPTVAVPPSSTKLQSPRVAKLTK